MLLSGENITEHIIKLFADEPSSRSCQDARSGTQKSHVLIIAWEMAHRNFSMPSCPLIVTFDFSQKFSHHDTAGFKFLYTPEYLNRGMRAARHVCT